LIITDKMKLEGLEHRCERSIEAWMSCRVESLARCFGRQSENKVKVVAAELGVGGASASRGQPRLLRRSVSDDFFLCDLVLPTSLILSDSVFLPSFCSGSLRAHP
jgi:hypothetical protein